MSLEKIRTIISEIDSLEEEIWVNPREFFVVNNYKTSLLTKEITLLIKNISFVPAEAAEAAATAATAAATAAEAAATAATAAEAEDIEAAKLPADVKASAATAAENIINLFKRESKLSLVLNNLDPSYLNLAKRISYHCFAVFSRSVEYNRFFLIELIRVIKKKEKEREELEAESRDEKIKKLNAEQKNIILESEKDLLNIKLFELEELENKEITAKNLEIQNLENLKNQLETNLKQQAKELNAKISQLEYEKTELEARNKNQQEYVEKAMHEKDTLLKQHEQFRDEVDRLNKFVVKISDDSKKELADQKKQAEEQLLAVTISAAALSNQITELETKVNDAEREKQFTEEKINNLEQEIQGLLKLKVQLEIDNEALTKNVEELKIEVGRQKDQISALQGEQQDLNYQLETLKGELNLTPESPNPEKQTLRQKISFFNDFLKRAQEQNRQLEENIKKEQEQSQTARQSLLELEDQLKGTSEDNKQQIIKLNQTNQDLRRQIKVLENNVKLEKEQVAKLQKQLFEKSAELKKLGITLIKQEQTLVQTQKEKKWWIYAFLIVVVIIGVGILYFSYQRLRKYLT